MPHHWPNEAKGRGCSVVKQPDGRVVVTGLGMVDWRLTADLQREGEICPSRCALGRAAATRMTGVEGVAMGWT